MALERPIPEDRTPAPFCTGTYSTWRKGCPCERCNEAKIEKRRLWKQRRKGKLQEDDKLIMCPVCESEGKQCWFETWSAQSRHERMIHSPGAATQRGLGGKWVKKGTE